MKFISEKELATKMKKNREIISREKTVITHRGKPIAVLYPVNEDNLGDMLNETPAAYGGQYMKELEEFKKAVAGLRREAGKRGITEKDINDAIRDARVTKAR